MSLMSLVGKAGFRLKSSFSVVLSSLSYSHETRPLSSNNHGCLTLHFANNSNERRAKALNPALPTAKHCMKWILTFYCLLIILTGCESIPFQKGPDQSYASVDPALVREHFKASLPVRSRLLNTIVFEYNWRTFSGIGFVDVDIPERACSLACINQMGMKLFEISIDKENINTTFALPEFTSKGDFAKMVGTDIKRIYFDLVPSDNAEIIKNKFAVVFSQ